MTEFGIQIEPQFGFDYATILDLAGLSHENHFGTMWFSDHFMLNEDATDRTLLDPWLAMASLCRDNDTIRVGSLVFCNSYRHPPLHAKMAATLDHLSGGRLEFGIGAGWKEMEYNAYGIPFPDDMTRIEQLAEAIQIIRGVWTEEKYTFDGAHYSVENLISFPKPVQNPHPTIWVGTMKAGPEMLKVTARYGDGINIAWSFSPQDATEIFGKLDKQIERYGRNPRDVKRSVGLWTRIFESKEEMDETIIRNAKERGMSEERYRKRVKSALWGTAEEIHDKIREYEHAGCDHLIFMFPYGEERQNIQLMGRSVLSKQ